MPYSVSPSIQVSNHSVHQMLPLVGITAVITFYEGMNNTKSKYWEQNSVYKPKSSISLLKIRTDSVLQNKTFPISSITVVHRCYLVSWENWKPQPPTCHTTSSNGKKGQLKSASSFVGSCGQDKLICILGENKNRYFYIFQVQFKM